MNDMENAIAKIRANWAAGDEVRDAGLTVPEDIVCHTDLRYGPHPENLLDVYYPVGTEKKLPTIISIHGGGWCYGSKQLYSHYCMRLAQRGFTVVNFDYRLAPENKYPAPLEDGCRVFAWVQEHAQQYCIDLDNLFTVGDSAGGQIEFQLLTILTNPQYAQQFPFAPPQGFRVKACVLNCGCYFFPPFSRFLSPGKASPMFAAYFPEDYLSIAKQIKVHKYVTREFPPAFVMTSANDYLRMMAKPVHMLLKRKKVETVLHVFGTKEQKEIGHCFHLNCYYPLAAQCNDLQCAFFRSHIEG